MDYEKIKREKITKNNIKEVWTKLIGNFGYKSGNNMVLQCFYLCSMYGIELEDSTIDDIVLLPDGNILFYYNSNTGDCENFDSFSYKDLKDFYRDFVSAYNDEVDFVYMENYGEGKDPY